MRIIQPSDRELLMSDENESADETLDRMTDLIASALAKKAKCAVLVDFGSLQVSYQINLDTHPLGLARHIEKFSRECRDQAKRCPK